MITNGATEPHIKKQPATKMIFILQIT